MTINLKLNEILSKLLSKHNSSHVSRSRHVDRLMNDSHTILEGQQWTYWRWIICYTYIDTYSTIYRHTYKYKYTYTHTRTDIHPPHTHACEPKTQEKYISPKTFVHLILQLTAANKAERNCDTFNWRVPCAIYNVSCITFH